MGVCNSVSPFPEKEYSLYKEQDLALYMPSYFLTEEPGSSDCELIINCWSHIHTFGCDSETSFHGANTSMEHFQDIFFSNLYGKLPAARTMLVNRKGRRSMFFSFFNLLLDGAKDLKKFKKELVNLTRRHYKFGVECEHYRILGETVFSTLSCVLGTRYTFETHTAWVRLYCVALRVTLGVTLYLDEKESKRVKPLTAYNVSMHTRRSSAVSDEEMLYAIPEEYQI